MPQGGMQESSKQTSSTQLPSYLQDAWNGLLTQVQNNPQQLANYDPGFQAPTNPYLTQAQQTAAGMKAPDYMSTRGQLGDLAGTAGVQVRSPYDVNVSNTYNPTAYKAQDYTGEKVQFDDVLAGYKPDMQAAQIAGHGFNAREYNFQADQVRAQQIAQAEKVQAERLGPAERVAAERIANPAADVKSFQFGPLQQINAPSLQQYQMQRPENVYARDVATNAFVDPGVRDQYMSPYMAEVVKRQQDDARRAFEEQLVQTGGNAASAGAFGGSRQAVLEGAMRRDLSNQQGNIAAQGFQSAFENAQQQFERDRAANMQAQQLNQAAGLQAGGMNQQAGLATNQANLQALLSQQELGANQGMRAQELNQNVALQRELANQQAALQAQGLGVNTNLQAMMANQQYGLQAALANQSANIDVGKANQAAMLQAAMANQASYADIAKANQAAQLQGDISNQGANLQAQMEGAKLGSQERQYQGGLNNAMNMAQAELTQGANQLNTQLGFDALKTRYGGGLQAGIANQGAAMDAMKMGMQDRQFAGTLGENQAQFGASMNLETQKAQQSIMDQIIRSNLAATGQAGQLLGQEAALEGQGFNQGLAANQQLGGFGLAQQGADQQAQQQAYQHWMAQQSWPMQQQMMLSQLLGGMSNQFGTQTTTGYQRGPGLLQMLGGLAATGAGIASQFVVPH